jgi:hypothetical protein
VNLVVESARIGGAVNMYGDSYTVGSNASSTISGTSVLDSYTNVFSYECGFWTGTAVTTTNRGLSGRAVEDLTASVYAQTTVSGMLSTYMTGFNNYRWSGSSGGYQTDAGLAQVVATWLASYAWLTLVTSKVIRGNGTGVSLIGSWSIPPAPVHTERTTTQTGASLSATVTGTAVYVAYLLQGSAGTFDLSIDGTDYGTINTSYAVNPRIATVSGAAVRIGGLPLGNHQVVLIANAASGPVSIDWIAGSSAAGGICLAGSIAHIDTTGYGATTDGMNAGSDALADKYNGAHTQLVNQLRGDGLDVRLANLDTIGYNVATDLSSDHIHPNDSGHAKIASAFAQAYWADSLESSTVTVIGGGGGESGGSRQLRRSR